MVYHIYATHKIQTILLRKNWESYRKTTVGFTEGRMVNGIKQERQDTQSGTLVEEWYTLMCQNEQFGEKRKRQK